MKLKKHDDRSVDTLPLLRRGNKILTGANIKTKCGTKTDAQPTIRMSTGSPMEELEKGLKELKGFAIP